MKVKDILKTITCELRLVEEELKSQIDQILKTQNSKILHYGYIKRVVKHFFITSGKLLRPALVILSAKSAVQSYTPDNSSLIKLATAVELVHSASLVHDDIIDDGKYRRQQASLNKKYGNQVAVLVGDILYTRFFTLLADLQLLSDKQKLEIFQMFLDTTQGMCLAEIKQQRIVSANAKPAFPEYLDILKSKTAMLMSACCRSGAMLLSADDTITRALGDFGLNFGLAFQLIDDYIDDDGISRLGLDTLESAREYISSAKNSLKPLRESESKDNFYELCEFVLNRAQTEGNSSKSAEGIKSAESH